MTTIEDLKIVIFGNFMIIGKSEGKILHGPRTVHVVPDKQGRFLVLLNPMVGNPEKITLPEAHISYGVIDENITSLYIQATTGLTVARNIGN